MKITSELVDRANSLGLSLDELVYLYNEHFQCGWKLTIFSGSLNKLKRLGYIDGAGHLTSSGEQIVVDNIEFDDPLQIRTGELERFEEIWMLFPVDDTTGIYGKTRQIRYNKAETFRAYKEALQYKSHEELVTALKNELAYRTQPNTNENLLKYMYISYNWFYKKGYENELKAEEIKSQYGKEIF